MTKNGHQEAACTARWARVGEARTGGQGFDSESQGAVGLDSCSHGAAGVSLGPAGATSLVSHNIARWASSYCS